MSVKGLVFDIKRFAVHDGPGIRTTVFLKGCRLRCPWCHNPEGVSSRPELFFSPDRCVGCGACLDACPSGAHRLEGGKHSLDRSLCRACGRCAEVCPSGALELVGREVSVHEVLTIVERDRPFHERSGGGLTISGGEPLVQFEFTKALLAEAKGRGIHTCLDTSGVAPWEEMGELLPFVDLFLFDLKLLDEGRHGELVGADLGPILENLRRLDEAGARIVLRCPIIPTVNDTDDHLRGLAELALSLENLEALEVLPFHKLAAEKYRRLGREYPFGGVKAPSEAEVEGWLSRLRELGVREARLG